METIKRIIMWIIRLFKKLFGIKDESSGTSQKNEINNKYKNKKEKIKNTSTNESMPSYMIIESGKKLSLINSIQALKEELLKSGDINKVIQRIAFLLDEEKIDNQIKINTISNIKSYLNNYSLDRLNTKKLDTLFSDFDDVTKNKICKIIKDSQENNEIIKLKISNLDRIIKYTKNNEISLETYNVINNIVEDLSAKNNKKDTIYNKDIINTIKNWDKNILDEVKLEYQKVNYVTISTVLIDKIINRYQKLEDDYLNHRYNKTYYEKEIQQIKDQINHLMRIKNTSSVYSEIERLRKELFTKSKDKYDVLYNNEIFININKKCDELLKQVNKKVIDIKKKKEETKNIDEEERKKQERLEKIIKRFQDINLSRKLILLYLEKQGNEFMNNNILSFINSANMEFINGINDEFNFQRNKTKTELVKLYNDLNMVISTNNKKDLIFIDHINFRMSDLVDAVIVKKNEVNNIIGDNNKIVNMDIIDEKLEEIKEKYLTSDEVKRLLKYNKN